MAPKKDKTNQKGTENTQSNSSKTVGENNEEEKNDVDYENLPEEDQLEILKIDPNIAKYLQKKTEENRDRIEEMKENRKKMRADDDKMQNIPTQMIFT